MEEVDDSGTQETPLGDNSKTKDDDMERESSVDFGIQNETVGMQLGQVSEDEICDALDSKVIPETNTDGSEDPELRGGEDDEELKDKEELKKLDKKEEELRNLLRHPDELEVRDGVEQEAHNEVPEEDNTIQHALDQDTNLAGLNIEKIVSYSFEDGKLFFLVCFTNGRECPVQYAYPKQDFPVEVAEYITREVDENDRYGKYGQWARKIIREERRQKMTTRRTSQEIKIRKTLIQDKFQD